MRVAKAFLLLSLIALIAADEPKKDDAETFKGTWTIALMKDGGRTVPEAPQGIPLSIR